MLLTARMYDVLDQLVLEVTHWGTLESQGAPGDFLGRAYGQRTCEHPACHLVSMSKGLWELGVSLQDELPSESHEG